MSLIAELKRRNVFRVGVAYADLGRGWEENLFVGQYFGVVKPSVSRPNSCS